MTSKIKVFGTLGIINQTVGWLLFLLPFLTACSGASMDNKTVLTAESTPTQVQDPATGASICLDGNDLSKIPDAYYTAMEKYTQTNNEYFVYVCTEDSNFDGTTDYMVVETSNRPEHESVYHHPDSGHHEDFDYNTNIYKYAAIHTDQTPHSAGNNMIDEQNIM